MSSSTMSPTVFAPVGSGAEDDARSSNFDVARSQPFSGGNGSRSRGGVVVRGARLASFFFDASGRPRLGASSLPPPC